MIKQLYNKYIPLVKVLLTDHNASKAIWETEEDMKTKNPYFVKVHILWFLKF